MSTKLRFAREADGQRKTKLSKDGAAQPSITFSAKEEQATRGGVALPSGPSGEHGKTVKPTAATTGDRKKPDIAEREVVPFLAQEMLKLMISNRQLNAILYDTYRLQSSSDLAKGLMQVGVEYNRATRGQRGHGLGSPWWHLWEEVMDSVDKTLADAAETEEVTKMIEMMRQYREEHKVPAAYAEEVRQIKVWESEHSHIMMVHINGKARVIWAQVVIPLYKTILEKTESPMAPPSHGERKLKRYVQKKAGKGD
eukprot:TRINITY_DN5911_c0_g1_i1.p1 TRINITY_DN5911_c0_g1~~TRINITY_DN5911_c0_g1_i1.p1  ORF type:complete len:254 (+),score=49.62 TRINITY_DN5911_c0_g1_i1:583-1344(+)